MPDLTQMQWRVDLHVHTRRYSPCAESLDAECLPEYMQHCGLHGLVITEHDHLWPEKEIRRLNRRLNGARIYRGVEVSSRHGHYLVIGLTRLDGIAPGIGAQKLIRLAREGEAAVILAHPMLRYSQMQASLDLAAVSAGVDAVEVASTVTVGRQMEEARVFARRLGCAQVGGSDAHCLAQVGREVTLFPQLPDNERELADLIRQGRCRARSCPPAEVARTAV